MQQSHSLDFKLVQRVCLLQQALDQALDSLDELTAQVQDKYWVETQLASTEKYANVQQQAINHLKQQLAQFTDIQNHLLGVMGFRLNELIGQQQQGFDQLNLQFQQSHTELQTYLQYLTQQQTGSLAVQDAKAYHRALEEEVMVARSMAVHLSQYLGLAKQHLGQLNADLSNHHLNLGQIIQTIQAMIAELAKFDHNPAQSPAPPTPSKRLLASTEARSPAALDPVAPPETDVEILQATVRRQEARIQELQSTLAQHVDQETRLRQRCQKVALQRDDYYRQLQQQSSPCNVNIEQLRPVPTPQLPPRQDAPPAPVHPQLRQRSLPSQPIQPLRLPEES